MGLSIYTKLLLKFPVLDQIFMDPSSPHVTKLPPSFDHFKEIRAPFLWASLMVFSILPDLEMSYKVPSV